MELWKKYQIELEEGISNLSYEQKMDFAIEICTRLLPEYSIFQTKHNWGDHKLVTDCLGYCKENLRTQNIDQDTIKSLLNNLDQVIPDTDDFGDIEASFALNSSLAVHYLLEYLVDKKNEHILNIANCMYDTVDFRVREANDGLKNDELDNHPSVVEERKWQLDKINTLANKL